MTSVREALNAVGQAVSIKDIAHQRHASFPLLLRPFVGALPPGQLRQKVISLDLLQRKFDEIFEERDWPLFKIRLHNLGSGDHRHSTLTVYKQYVHDQYEPLIGPKDLGQLTSSIADYHFNDLNSRIILSPDFIREQPLGLKVLIYFEIKGEELKLNNLPDVNFTSFKIEMTFTFALGRDNTILGIQQKRINADVATNATPGYRAIVESQIESGFRSKLYDTLYDVDQESGERKIDGLNRTLKTWLLGGDFYVVNVSSDEQSLTIDYILPPGQLEPFPEHPQPPLDPGLLGNIDHIVVLMMENRSFDHMLGYLSKEGGRADVKGLHGNETNPYNGCDYLSFPLVDTQFDVSPNHRNDPVMHQINNGKMDGFVADFAKHLEDQGIVDVDPGRIMGYHNADHVPVYDALAREFLICQYWFAAHPGPTFCNRFYTVTGRLNRKAADEWQVDNEAKPVSTKTLFDHLSEHGVSWRYYEHRYCFLRLFERYTFDDTHIVDANDQAKGFFASAQAGTLPAVSFIDPNFIDEPDGQDNDDGAPADIRAGQNLIGRVVNAVMQGPQWNKTLLVITYDEHGGFFDHVSPLKEEFRDKAIPVCRIDHYGVRVPTFIISPWVDQRAVSNVVFDHTAIAKTIARRFMSANPPDMGERVAAANDLSMVLRTTPRQDLPHIPVPLVPARDRTLTTQTPSPGESDDFKELMRTMYARHRGLR